MDPINRLSCGQGGKPAVDAKTERVKGICAFTRSIGDCQMKDPAAAALFNSFRTVKVEPRPGTLPHDSTKPVRLQTATQSQPLLLSGILSLGCLSISSLGS